MFGTEGWYLPVDYTTSGSEPAVFSCPGLEPAGYVLAANQACVEQITIDDPFCVTTDWDGICQTAYDCCVNDTFGCTDPTACNYDATAVCNDGSCIYGGPFWYLPVDYTSSTSEPAVLACTGEEPAGYVLAADQACVQSVVDADPFCVDTDWDAICENSYQCCLPGAVSGCTDDTACNYDPLATCDDFSCIYGCCCPGDADNNGLVNVLDLIAVSSNFGCVGCTSGDADCNGTVNILDLVAVSSSFGSICP